MTNLHDMKYDIDVKQKIIGDIYIYVYVSVCVCIYVYI